MSEEVRRASWLGTALEDSSPGERLQMQRPRGGHEMRVLKDRKEALTAEPVTSLHHAQVPTWGQEPSPQLGYKCHSSLTAPSLHCTGLGAPGGQGTYWLSLHPTMLRRAHAQVSADWPTEQLQTGSASALDTQQRVGVCVEAGRGGSLEVTRASQGSGLNPQRAPNTTCVSLQGRRRNREHPWTCRRL